MRGEKILEEGLSVKGACESRSDEWTRQVIVNVESMFTVSVCQAEVSGCLARHGLFGASGLLKIKGQPTGTSKR